MADYISIDCLQCITSDLIGRQCIRSDVIGQQPIRWQCDWVLLTLEVLWSEALGVGRVFGESLVHLRVFIQGEEV